VAFRDVLDTRRLYMTASGSPANDNEADSQDTGSEALARMAVRDNGVRNLNEARGATR